MRRTIIAAAIVIAAVVAFVRWWQSPLQRRLRDVAREDREHGAGSGDIDLEDYLGR